MAKSEAIELLNQLLGKIPHLRELNHDNQEYRLWHAEVRDTLESIFGRDSVEYKRFTGGFKSWKYTASEAEKQERYVKELDKHETDLNSIIQRQEIKKTLNRAGERLNKDEAIDALRSVLNLLRNKLWYLHYHERFEEYPRWRDTVSDILRGAFGEQSDKYRTFAAISDPKSWFEWRPTVTNELFREKVHKRHYQEHLKKVDDTLERIILKYQIRRPPSVPQTLKKAGRSSGRWIKTHKIPSAVITVLLIIITLLGTKWSTVAENIAMGLEWLRKLW